jgi:hypothetical protein
MRCRLPRGGQSPEWPSLILAPLDSLTKHRAGMPGSVTAASKAAEVVIE